MTHNNENRVISRLTQIPRIELDVSLKLNESEICALEALAGYGTDVFLKVFYAQMGRAYLEPHEKGLRSLFNTIQETLPPIMHRMTTARQAFHLKDPVLLSRADHDALVQRLINATKEPQ